MKYVAVIVNHADTAQKTKQILTRCEKTQFIFFSSIAEFMQGGKDKPWNGIVCDFRTIIHPCADKAAFLQMAEFFPFLKLRFDTAGLVTGSIGGANLMGDDLLRAFFEQVEKFEPRHLRESFRKQISLNISFRTLDGSSVQHWQHGLTANISRRGVFLIDMEPDPTARHVEIIFHDFADKSPMRCSIQWMMAWGTAIGVFPGYGLKILELNERIRHELEAFAGSATYTTEIDVTA